MTILKRQFIKNLKGLVIWTLSIAGLLAMMLAQFKSTGSGIDTSAYSEQFKAAMGLNLVDMNTFLGYYAIKASIMVTLFGGIYAAILGSGLIVKDESLLSRPISREKILVERFLAGMADIFLLNLIIAAIIFIAENDVTIIWIALGQFLLHMVFFSLGLLTAVAKLKARTAMVMPIGIVLATYVLSLIYGMAEKLEFIKYLSPFWYTDSKEIVVNGFMSAANIIVTCALALVLAVLSYMVYIKRDMPT